jgi:hypothetical protein
MKKKMEKSQEELPEADIELAAEDKSALYLPHLYH